MVIRFLTILVNRIKRTKGYFQQRQLTDTKHIVSKKWANPGLFLNIFVFSKHSTDNSVATRIQTQINDDEGKDANHFTTMTAQT